MIRMAVVTVALIPWLLATPAHAQSTLRPGSFHIEWMRTPEGFRPAVEGYVYNNSNYRIGTVRLRVELLDGADRIVSERFAWVYGDIDAGGRGYFTLPPPAADGSYRITVESFFVISRQAP